MRQPARPHIQNTTSFKTASLRAFVRKGLKACGSSKEKLVLFHPTRGRISSACTAEHGSRMTFTLPERVLTSAEMESLARHFEHQVSHCDGMTHDGQTRALLRLEPCLGGRAHAGTEGCSQT